MNRLTHALVHAEKLTIKRLGLDKPGFVYLIQCHDFVKVGMAQDVKLRLLTLQTGNPYELKLIAQWPVSHMAEAETKLHLLWKRHEIRGEWFQIPCGELASVMNATAFEDIF